MRDGFEILEEEKALLIAENARLKDRIDILGQAMDTGEKEAASYLVEAYAQIDRLKTLLTEANEALKYDVNADELIELIEAELGEEQREAEE